MNGLQSGHDFAGLFGHAHHEIDDVIRSSLKLGTPFWIGRRNPDRAVVQVALANIDATHGDHCDGSEIHLLGAENCRDDNIPSGAQASIGAQRDKIS